MLHKRGVTLIELMISMLISSLVLAALTAGIRQATSFLAYGDEFARIDRSATLFLEQFERDLMAVHAPSMHQPEKKTVEREADAKEGSVSKQEPGNTKQKDSGNMKKKGGEKANLQAPSRQTRVVTPFFSTQIDDDVFTRFGEVKRHLFMEVSFITTNPLRFHGILATRPVRVAYRLIPNKSALISDTELYRLVRIETSDLSDTQLRGEPDIRRGYRGATRVTVLDGIYALYVEYEVRAYTVDKQTKKKTLQRQRRQKISDTLPERVFVRLELAGKVSTRRIMYETTVPLVSGIFGKQKEHA